MKIWCLQVVDTTIRNKLDGYKTISTALKTLFSRKKEKVRKASKSQYNLLRNTFT